MGDELGVQNDYSYSQDPAKKDDSRWVNRVAVSDRDLAKATDGSTLSGRIYQQLQQLVQTRAKLPVLGHGSTQILACGNQHLFMYQREWQGQRMVCLVNFSEHAQVCSDLPGQQWRDELNQQTLQGQRINVAPYQVFWLSAI
jgi:amylosucrase